MKKEGQRKGEGEHRALTIVSRFCAISILTSLAIEYVEDGDLNGKYMIGLSGRTINNAGVTSNLSIIIYKILPSGEYGDYLLTQIPIFLTDVHQ